jgi:hypothetical protein
MDTRDTMQIEPTFLSLPGEERETIISLGATLRLSYLKKRLFLAENKIKHFQEHYGTTLAQLEAEGLPDDADYRMHEDYIMWSHWSNVIDRIKTDITALESIVKQGLYLGELSYAGL